MLPGLPGFYPDYPDFPDFYPGFQIFRKKSYLLEYFESWSFYVKYFYVFWIISDENIPDFFQIIPGFSEFLAGFAI